MINMSPSYERLNMAIIIDTVIPTTQEALFDLMSCISSASHDAGLSASTCYRVDLVVEEMVSNIIKYGAPDAPADAHHVHLRITEQPASIRIDIIDDTHPFNPLEQEAPSTEQPLDDRAIGGLGIHMVREISEKMLYHRYENMNTLSVVVQKTLE